MWSSAVSSCQASSQRSAWGKFLYRLTDFGLSICFVYASVCRSNNPPNKAAYAVPSIVVLNLAFVAKKTWRMYATSTSVSCRGLRATPARPFSSKRQGMLVRFKNDIRPEFSRNDELTKDRQPSSTEQMQEVSHDHPDMMQQRDTS